MIGFGPGTDRGSDVAIQEDGKIVVAGDSDQYAPTGFDFALARLLPDGSLDPSFSGDGKRLTSFSPQLEDGSDSGESVAIRGDARIVVAGSANQSFPTGDFAVARYMPDGSLDDSFSGNGKRIVSFAGGEAGQDLAIAAGKIVIAGTSFDGPDLALARLNSDGSIDDSFSGDGKRLTGFGPGSNDAASGVAIQGNGRIVAAGYSDTGGPTGYDFAIARLMPNGDFDASFSQDGRRLTAFGNGSGEDFGSDLALYDSRIVVVGTSNQGSPTGRDFAVARFLAG